jgi:hypothetical protein
MVNGFQLLTIKFTIKLLQLYNNIIAGSVNLPVHHRTQIEYPALLISDSSNRRCYLLWVAYPPNRTIQTSNRSNPMIVLTNAARLFWSYAAFQNVHPMFTPPTLSSILLIILSSTANPANVLK